MQITTERITVPVDGGSMAAYLARPAEGGPHPAVLVFQEIFGVNGHIRKVTERVAAEGYVACAPEVFHRTAPGIEIGYDDAGLQKGMALMAQVKASEAVADTRAAIAALEKRPEVGGTGVGAMGFCFGGHLTYLAACELPIAAAASFYGGFIAVGAPGGEAPRTVDRTARIRGRILCLFGEQDSYIPAEQVAEIKQKLAQHDIRHEVVVYPGVGHGFFCDERPDYDRKSAEDAWRRVTTLFREELRS